MSRPGRLNVEAADAAIYRCPVCAVWRIAPPYARARHRCRTVREVLTGRARHGWVVTR